MDVASERCPTRLHDGGWQDERCSFADWRQRALRATASVYMILLPLPVLEPDLITDQPGGTKKAKQYWRWRWGQFLNMLELKGEEIDARTPHPAIQPHRTQGSRTCWVWNHVPVCLVSERSGSPLFLQDLCLHALQTPLQTSSPVLTVPPWLEWTYGPLLSFFLEILKLFLKDLAC